MGVPDTAIHTDVQCPRNMTDCRMERERIRDEIKSHGSYVQYNCSWCLLPWFICNRWTKTESNWYNPNKKEVCQFGYVWTDLIGVVWCNHEDMVFTMLDFVQSGMGQRLKTENSRHGRRIGELGVGKAGKFLRDKRKLPNGELGNYMFVVMCCVVTKLLGLDGSDSLP